MLNEPRTACPAGVGRTRPSAFPAHERRLLLSLPRIGPTVVQRIEAQGVSSLQDLRRVGVDEVVDAICRRVGTPAWANRRSALVDALRAAAQSAGDAAAPDA